MAAATTEARARCDAARRGSAAILIIGFLLLLARPVGAARRRGPTLSRFLMESMERSGSEVSSEEAQSKMDAFIEYRHEDGMNYSAPLWNRFIIGSCVQTPEDVDKLKEENVGVILNLQEDADMAQFDLDLEPILNRSAEVGIDHVRCPIRDFDPLSLRRKLPVAVRALAAALSKRSAGELAYIHCTAGLGRAPGTALAYMFMLNDVCLDTAKKQLLEVRSCFPKLSIIRAATCDVLDSIEKVGHISLSIRRTDAGTVEIAGLDVGWNGRLKMKKFGNGGSAGEFVLDHTLPVGKYKYKFIVDGVWQPSMDLPTEEDEYGSFNNVIEVVPDDDSKKQAEERRERIMADGGRPTKDERQELKKLVLSGRSA